MKQYIKNNGMSFILLGMAIGFALWSLPLLPEKIPTHFNFEGQPDAYGNRIFALIFLPLVNLALLFFLPSMIKLSPNSYQMENSQKGLSRINFAITFLLCGMYVVTLKSSIGHEVLPSFINLAFMMSVFMIFLGNYLSKVERNFFAGIRTPWTLVSEGNWLATHRFAAKVFVVFGVLSTILSFVVTKLYWSVGFILLASLISVLYSFYYFVKHEKTSQSV